MTPAAPRSVDIVVYPGFKALEAIATMSVFEYANTHLAARGRARGYRVEVVACEAGPVASDMQMSLQATRSLDAAVLPDIAVIVGARGIENAVERLPDLVNWARAAAPRIHRLVALCSGTFFLAAAGLLDGQRAATHWSVAHVLQKSFPQVKVDADAIYVTSRDQQKIIRLRKRN